MSATPDRQKLLRRPSKLPGVRGQGREGPGSRRGAWSRGVCRGLCFQGAVNIRASSSQFSFFPKPETLGGMQTGQCRLFSGVYSQGDLDTAGIQQAGGRVVPRTEVSPDMGLQDGARGRCGQKGLGKRRAGDGSPEEGEGSRWRGREGSRAPERSDDEAVPCSVSPSLPVPAPVMPVFFAPGSSHMVPWFLLTAPYPTALRDRHLSFGVVVIHVGVSSSDVIFLRSESPLSFGSQPLSATPVALDTDCHCPWFLKCKSGLGADVGPGASGCYRQPEHWKVHCRLGSTGSSGHGDSYRKLELRGRPDVCEMNERPGVGKAGLS